MLIDKLKESKIRFTPQRLAIIKYLEGNTSHPSVEDIYSEIKRDFPSLSMATVYNTLQVLCNLGIVQEINIEAGKMHFDPNPEPHCHFYCLTCKKVYDFEADIQQWEVPCFMDNFWVEKYYVNFVGTCNNCANK